MLPHHNCFTALFPGPPGWAGARRELLDFMLPGRINRGRHTNQQAGRHSIRTNQRPPPPSPINCTLMHTVQHGDSLPWAARKQLKRLRCSLECWGSCVQGTCITWECTPWAIKRSWLIFVCNFVKNHRILMQFSLLDFEMNHTCNMWEQKLHPPHLINVYATLWKSKHKKMHVNTTSAFNATKYPYMHLNYIESLVNHINEHSVRSCVQSVHHQHAHMISDGHTTGQSHRQWRPGRSESKFANFASSIFTGRQYHESLFHTHCRITPQISKFNAHYDPGPLWRYETSDAIFFGNIPL